MYSVPLGAAQAQLSPAQTMIANSINADSVALKMLFEFAEQARVALSNAMSNGSMMQYAYAKGLMYAVGTALVKYAGAMDVEYRAVVISYPPEHAATVRAYQQALAQAGTILAQKIPAVLLPSPVAPNLMDTASVTIQFLSKQ